MSQARKPGAYVALLRGINMGGKNKLPMRELAQLFVDAGCTDVRTYIQSGNVVFHIAPGKAEKIPAILTSRIAEVFSLKVPVVVRSAAEIAAVIESNPFLKAGKPADTLHVMFLADRPDAARVAALDPDRSPPDRYIVQGREIYLHLPQGVADSKLTNAYFDSKLATICTGRNWRTILTLCEMCAS